MGGEDRCLFSELARGTRHRGCWGFRGDRPRPSAAGGELLRSVRLIDLYKGEHVSGGRKSMIFSLRFQVPERTLKQEEVLPVMGQIEQVLADRFGATKRA